MVTSGLRPGLRKVAGVPIEPETKDWTWVLDETCHECGLDTRSVAATDVPALVRENAAVWPGVLARPDAAQRPDDSTWSPLEYACHVRDVYRLFAVRLNLMLTADDPLFPNWDQDDDGGRRALRRAGPRHGGRRAASPPARRSRPTSTPSRATSGSGPGRRSDGAVFTVESFARYFVHDSVHHVHDVTT